MILDLFNLALGLIVVVFNKPYARYVVNYHAAFHEKFFKQKPGPGMILFARVLSVVIGLFLATGSLLHLMGFLE